MDIHYLNARVRGLRSRLYREPDYDGFISLDGGIEGLIDSLRGGPYGPYITVADRPGIGPDSILSDGLRAGLKSSFNTVWKASDGKIRLYLKGLFSLWEVTNLNSVIRGVDQGIGQDEIFASLIPAGEFDIGALRELSSSKGMNELLSRLTVWSSPYAKPIREAMPEYVRTGRLAAMELGLDRLAMNILNEGIKAGGPSGCVLAELRSYRSDSVNLFTLFKTQGEGFSKEALAPLFMEGGRTLDWKTFLALSKTEERDDLLTGFIRAVSEESYKRALLDLDSGELKTIEERIEAVMLRALSRLIITEPESIALVGWYIYSASREVYNLRILGSSKRMGIPDGECKRMLSIPGTDAMWDAQSSLPRARV